MTIRTEFVTGAIAASPMFLYGIDVFGFEVAVLVYLMLVLGVVLKDDADGGGGR